MHRRTLTLASSLAVGASLLVTAAAGASSGDRNHDRIPDRWEHRHHLSLHVNQAHRDQDRDGFDNLAEFRAHTDPRHAEVRAANDGAGTIASFTNGVLTITLAHGGTLSAAVTADTRIECDGSQMARASDHGGGDNRGPGNSGDDNGDNGNHGDDNGDNDDNDVENCGANPLTAGRAVVQAEIRAASGSATFEEIDLGA